MKVYCSIPYKRTYYKFGCLRADISMQSWIPMEMTQCLKNDYEEGCSLDRKQKTSKKEKLSKENGLSLYSAYNDFVRKSFDCPVFQ